MARDLKQYLEPKYGYIFLYSFIEKEFIPGDKYYFEIYITKGSLIKIGVSRPGVALNEAFSDTKDGWAIYNG